MKQVLIYNGAGTSTFARNYAFKTLTKFLSPHYAVRFVTAQTLQAAPWLEHTALLVMPGGRDLPYVETFQGKINQLIRKFVQDGGRYLGLCAGAYYACEKVNFEPGTKIQVQGDRELGFFKGIAMGSISKEFKYNSFANVDEQASQEELYKLTCIYEGGSVKCVVNGGCAFVPTTEAQNSKILARYASIGALNISAETEEGLNPRFVQMSEAENAVVLCNVGQGKALLCGPHPEYLSVPSDRENVEFMHYLLSQLDLTINRIDQLQEDYAGLNSAFSEAQKVIYLYSEAKITADAIWSKWCDTASEKMFIEGDSDKFYLQQKCETEKGENQWFLRRYQDQPIKFDVTEFRRELKQTRSWLEKKMKNETGNPNSRIGWRFGEVVLYADEITSSQTILERNRNLVKDLPTGTVMIVTRQTKGKGFYNNSQ